MAEPKTKANDASVEAFINTVESEQKRRDSFTLLEVFTRLTGEQPVMWGTGIIGFGTYHYASERSGQKGDWMLTGFSPRKKNLTLYIMPGLEPYAGLLHKLGKYTTSKSCLYVNKLEDIDLVILEEIISLSYQDMKSSTAE